MIQDDFGAGKRAGKIGQFADLRMIHQASKDRPCLPSSAKPSRKVLSPSSPGGAGTRDY